jgi:hypothetical protein
MSGFVPVVRFVAKKRPAAILSETQSWTLGQERMAAICNLKSAICNQL